MRSTISILHFKSSCSIEARWGQGVDHSALVLRTDGLASPLYQVRGTWFWVGPRTPVSLTSASISQKVCAKSRHNVAGFHFNNRHRHQILVVVVEVVEVVES